MKSIFTLFLAFVSVATFAQKDFQGKATYMSKTTMDMSSWGRGGQMSEAQKKQIASRMKSMLEKTFILTFDKTSSLYKEDAKLEAPGAGGGFRFGGFGGGGIKYKNTIENVSLESTEFFGKKFLVSDDMKKPEWELGSETKQIGNYVCYKATLVKDVDPMDFTNMRRRKKDDKKDGDKKEDVKKDTSNVVKISDEIEMPKQIEVVAWYTPQIPVSNGPGEYWGLPGLILEINSGRTTVLCTEIVMNPSEKEAIEMPTKGKKITREDYNATVKKKMEEMRERFRGSGRGGRGRGRF
jgi:GLPGLI family protein